MNRVSVKSNLGEGGEDVVRGLDLVDVEKKGHLAGLKNANSANSYVQEVASGRFGMTPQFLTTAKQLGMKMAQSAKLGEGDSCRGQRFWSILLV